MRKSSIFAAISGNIIEWYDFTLYIFLAPVLARNFFSQSNHLNAMLSTFIIFAVGFFVRPLGAIAFGHWGDRLGRVRSLKITILWISLSTLFIAFLPTYQQWGIYASLSLAFFRLIQGFCIGGEFAGSMIYLTEMAASHRRAFFSSMANNGSNFGVLCATLIAALISSLISPASFDSYGWRIAFGLGGIVGLVGLWFRRNIQETPIFEILKKQQQLQRVPLLTIFKKYKKPVIKVFFLLLMAATGSYALMDFMSTYLHQYFHYSLKSALQVQSLYNLLTFALVIISAKLSDRYGRRSILMIAAIGYIILSVPCFYLLKTTGLALFLLPLVIFYGLEEATSPVAMVELFPASARYTGISIGYNLAMALCGGTAPLINTWLVEKFHNPLIIAYYLAGSAVVSLIVIITSLPREYGYTCSLVD